MAQPLDPEIHRIQLSLNDFIQTEEFAEAAMQHPIESLEYEALVHNAILHYARPYGTNEQGRTTPQEHRSLMSIDIAATLGPDFEFHKLIVRLRNKGVAHAEAAFFPAQLGPVPAGDAGGFIIDGKNWNVRDERLDLARLVKIAATMKRATIEHILNRAAAKGLIQPRRED
jgi:hypothetical protein